VSTALHLVRKERIAAHRIVLLDKATFPRDKPCAGAISSAGVDAFAALGLEIGVPFIEMRGVRVLMDGASGETSSPAGVLVRRSEYDARRICDVREDGVVVREGESLVAMERVGLGGFSLTTSKGHVSARFVAACDGTGSAVRKCLGLREAARKGHLYVLETPLGASDDAVRRSVIDFDLSPIADGIEGYYWDFPTIIEGHVHATRGIYHANLDRRADAVDVKAALTRALSRRGVDLASVRPRPFSTRPFTPSSIMHLPGVVLVGEAAGIDRATGEGIAQSILMGAHAARHLARGLRTGLSSFEAYAHDVRSSTMGRHMLQSAWLALHAFGRAGAPMRRILLRSPFARAAAMRWYRGESLGPLAKARLGVRLLASAV
jgi:flavin-dependent dehydrogenase